MSESYDYHTDDDNDGEAEQLTISMTMDELFSLDELLSSVVHRPRLDRLSDVLRELKRSVRNRFADNHKLRQENRHLHSTVETLRRELVAERDAHPIPFDGLNEEEQAACRNNQKIFAIKSVRARVRPLLGLKEAKDIVDAWCEKNVPDARYFPA